MKLAVVQTQTTGKADANIIQTNLIILRNACAEAKANGATLILFPELFLQGYCSGKQLLHELAISCNAQEIQHIQAIAHEFQLAVCFGYAETSLQFDTATYYNSAMLISSNGQIVHNYRKTHLYSGYETNIFTPSDKEDFSVHFLHDNTSIGIGMIICYDIEFPEPARILALRGAKLILVPTANTDPYTTTVLVRARSYENHVFVAYANKLGNEDAIVSNDNTTRTMKFCGMSCITAPNGQFLQEAANTIANDDQHYTIIYSEIKPQEFEEDEQSLPYLKDRRPEMYGYICNK